MANSPSVSVNKLTLVAGDVQSVKGVSIADASAGKSTLTVTIADKNGLLNVSAPQTVIVTGLNSNSLTLKGTLGDINTTLGTLTDTNKVGGDDNLLISVVDSGTKLTGTGTEFIHFNTAPTIPTADISLLKGVATKVSTLIVSDSDNSNPFVDVAIRYPTTLNLQFTTNTPMGSQQYYDSLHNWYCTTKFTNSGGYSTISGPLSYVNTILSGLLVSSSSAGTNDVSISIKDSDYYYNYASTPYNVLNIAGTGLSSNNVVHFKTATPATVNSTPQGILTNQTAIPLKNIVIADDSAGASKLTVTINDTNGVLNVSPTTGLTIISGANSKNLVIAGTLDVINKALTTLTDVSTVYGPDNLSFSILDSGTNLTGTGVAKVGVGVIPDLLGKNTSQSIVIGTTNSITGLSIVDAAAGASTITVVISDTNGVLNVTPSSDLTILKPSTNQLTLQGTLAAVNRALGTLTDSNSQNVIDNLNFTITDSGSLFSNTAVVTVLNSPSVNTTTKSLLVQSSNVQNLDGSNGNSVFKFSANMFGTPSETNFVAIKNWIGKDVISYSSLLSVVGNSGSPVKGMASINKITGVATFNNTDNTLALKLSAVEKAISSVNTPALGHVAIFADSGDTYAIVTDNHVGTGIGSGDCLIKFIGTAIEHIGLANGILVAL
jgi:hypothetical protein